MPRQNQLNRRERQPNPLGQLTNLLQQANMLHQAALEMNAVTLNKLATEAVSLDKQLKMQATHAQTELAVFKQRIDKRQKQHRS